MTQEELELQQMEEARKEFKNIIEEHKARYEREEQQRQELLARMV